MTRAALKIDPARSAPLLAEVAARSGQVLQTCYQCRRCAAGCPVGRESGMTPDRLVRLVLLGDREAALENLLVWKCLACYTCGTRCPNGIQTAMITAALKQMSKEEHRAPLVPKVAAFHGAFMRATERDGRFNEIVGMGMYEMRAAASELKRGGVKAAFAEIAGQMKLGAAMTRKKRMHLGIERVRGGAEIKALYRKAAARAGRKGR